MSNEPREVCSGSIILAALLGGAVGALVGVMVAPKSGKELRQDISVKAKETWGNLDLLEEGKGVLSDIRDTLSDLKHDLKHKRNKSCKVGDDAAEEALDV
ncbi:MAG: YtxH domain-containing protein [Peptococcaceae bacterium]|jgi:gas vesicle protein|nr:YtxH domain-containing protein [Peptococcaceae bacterium]